uniref:TGF-beta family profile domain-containing protein n=1 Tax=Timema genevievae TaxID=629358 RepID=A0A7R9PM98_TIMGE|nr:unnamed protein product [Timema genevievae]
MFADHSPSRTSKMEGKTKEELGASAGKSEVWEGVHLETGQQKNNNKELTKWTQGQWYYPRTQTNIYQILSLTEVSLRSLRPLEAVPMLKDPSFPTEFSHFNLEAVGLVYTLSVPQELVNLVVSFELGSIAVFFELGALAIYQELETYSIWNLLVFNVSCVGRGEYLQLAQIHLHRRPHHSGRRALAPPYKVKLYQVQHSRKARIIPLASIPVPQSTRGGWLTLESTAALRDLVLLQSHGDLLLGVRFEAPRGRMIPPIQFLKDPVSETFPAFLVVFSEDPMEDTPGTSPTHTHALAGLLRSTGAELSALDDTFLDVERNQDGGHQFPFRENNETKQELYLEELYSSMRPIHAPITDGNDNSLENQRSPISSIKKYNPRPNLKDNDSSLEIQGSHSSDGKRNNRRPTLYNDDNSLEIPRSHFSGGKRDNYRPTQDNNDNSLEIQRIHSSGGKRGSYRNTLDNNDNSREIKRSHSSGGKRNNRKPTLNNNDNSLDNQKSHSLGGKRGNQIPTLDYNDSSLEIQESRSSGVKRENHSPPINDNDSMEIQRSLSLGVKRDKHKRRRERLSQMSLFNVEGNPLEDGQHNKPLLITSNKVDEGFESSQKRVVRSIVDNELPDSGPAPFNRAIKTSPETFLRGRPSSAESKEDSIIPFPPSRRRGKGNKRRKGEGKRKEHRRKGKKNFKEDWSSPEKEDSLRENGTGVVASSTDEMCRRKKLVVNFGDIGWSDWVISPENFQAHYCAGRCPFPLNKEIRSKKRYRGRHRALNPTNHATIQSLVHAIGAQPGVPAPCCVPDHLSPMTLLYMDEAGNVVLKNYPSMTVDSCACR